MTILTAPFRVNPKPHEGRGAATSPMANLFWRRFTDHSGYLTRGGLGFSPPKSCSCSVPPSGTGLVIVIEKYRERRQERSITITRTSTNNQKCTYRHGISEIWDWNKFALPHRRSGVDRSLSFVLIRVERRPIRRRGRIKPEDCLTSANLGGLNAPSRNPYLWMDTATARPVPLDSGN
jgi:hypothetical protein